eukprot:1159404-Pyramimonas_sp.AAC.1
MAIVQHVADAMGGRCSTQAPLRSIGTRTSPHEEARLSRGALPSSAGCFSPTWHPRARGRFLQHWWGVTKGVGGSSRLAPACVAAPPYLRTFCGPCTSSGSAGGPPTTPATSTPLVCPSRSRCALIIVPALIGTAKAE